MTPKELERKIREVLREFNATYGTSTAIAVALLMALYVLLSGG